MKPKICYIVTLPITIRAFFIPQLKYLSKHGFDVTVICSPDDKLQNELGDEISYVPVDIPRGISFKRTLHAINELSDLFKKQKYELIQYSTPNAAFCASIAGKSARIRVRNYHLMGLRYLGESGVKRVLLKAIEKWTCNNSTNIECVSNSNLSLSINEGLFPREKGTVVFHGSSGGVNLDRFDNAYCREYRTEIRKDYSIPESAYVYGFVGRITKDKGINELLSAFTRIDSGYLLMVGYTDEIESLDVELYEWSKRCSRIIYTGPVNDVEKYYAAIDCLVLPSYREGFGNVVIEAAAMGTPAIVSRIPGPIDTSIENKTALWIEPHDIESLYSAMKKIEIVGSSMNVDCVEYVRNNFDDNRLNIEILKRKRSLVNSSNSMNR